MRAEREPVEPIEPVLDRARAAAAATIEFDDVEPFEVLFASATGAIGVSVRAAVEPQHGPDLLADAAQDVGVARVVIRERGR
jgi:hypothetical protein